MDWWKKQSITKKRLIGAAALFFTYFFTAEYFMPFLPGFLGALVGYGVYAVVLFLLIYRFPEERKKPPKSV